MLFFIVAQVLKQNRWRFSCAGFYESKLCYLTIFECTEAICFMFLQYLTTIFFHGNLFSC